MENRPEANCEVQFISGVKIVYNAEKRIIELKRNANDRQPIILEPNVSEIGMASFIKIIIVPKIMTLIVPTYLCTID